MLFAPHEMWNRLLGGQRLSPGLCSGDGGHEGTARRRSVLMLPTLRRGSFFEKMLGYANHLGLYGEELGPQGQHRGNFPQAFTHLALVSAAFDLDRRLSAAGHAG